MNYKYKTMFCEAAEDVDEFLNDVESKNIDDTTLEIVGYSSVGTNDAGGEEGGVWVTVKYYN